MSALLNRAIFILQSIPGVKFVIQLPDGITHTHGDLKLEKAGGKRRSFQYPVGTVVAHYKPYIEKLNAGEIVEVPFDKFDPTSMRGGIASFCVSNWGRGSAATAINRTKQCIEVLRFK